MAAAYNNLGNVDTHIGDYASAKDSYEKGLAIQLATAGETDFQSQTMKERSMPTVLQAWIQVAWLHRTTISAVWRATSGTLRRRRSGTTNALPFDWRHLVLLSPFLTHRCVLSRDSICYLNAVWKEGQRCTLIGLGVIGECHPDVAASYSNLGNAERRMHNLVRAKEYFEHSLSIRLATLGLLCYFSSVTQSCHNCDG